MLMGMCACSGGIPYNISCITLSSLLSLAWRSSLLLVDCQNRNIFYPQDLLCCCKIGAVSTEIYWVQPWTKSGNVTAFNVFITGELTISRFHLHQIRVCHELPQVQAPVIMALKSLNYKHMLYLSGNGLLVKCNWYKRKLWFSLLYF